MMALVLLLAWPVAAAAAGLIVPVPVATSETFEMGEVWEPLVRVLSHLSIEEFVMLLNKTENVSR